MPARTPRPRTAPREITITVKVRSIVDGVLPESVMRTLKEQLVEQIGTMANPDCVTVDLEVSAVLDTEKQGVRW